MPKYRITFEAMIQADSMQQACQYVSPPAVYGYPNPNIARIVRVEEATEVDGELAQIIETLRRLRT